MNDDVKPCPFCGHPARAWKALDRGWVVTCMGGDCPVMVGTLHDHRSRDAAVAAWNRRAEVAEAGEETNELEERILGLFENYEPSGIELEIAIEYERQTGFEPLYLEEVDSAESCLSAMSKNVRWFSDWAMEVAGLLDERIQKLVDESQEEAQDEV